MSTGWHFRNQTRCAQLLEASERTRSAEAARRSSLRVRQQASSSHSVELGQSQELRGRAGSSGSNRNAASEAVGGMLEAARRAPGAQRCRWGAGSIFVRRSASFIGRRCRCLTLLVARLECAGARRFEHRGAFPESDAMRATARSFGAHPLCRGGSQKLSSGSSASFILAFGRAWAKPRASRASGKQRLKSERCVRSCRWHA